MGDTFTKVDAKAIEGKPGARILRSAEDVADVIAVCFEQNVQAVLLYAENLTEHFFDLSSGEAGAILQKLRNYRIRLAVVVPTGGVAQSYRFREMLLEESKGGDFRVFGNRALALAWLAAG